jgi:hypothetical protein
MSTMEPRSSRAAGPSGGASAPASSGNLGDILERVLDKGIVIVGDIQVNLLDIELLTIKLRLVVASVDTARQMGIDWWESDPTLSARGGEDRRGLGERVERLERALEGDDEGRPPLDSGEVDEDNEALRRRVRELERQLKRASRSDEADDG